MFTAAAFGLYGMILFTYYPMPGLSLQNWFFYKEAYDMDMFKVVDMIATIQQHVDQGISFTLFLKDTMTTRDLNRIEQILMQSKQ